MLVPYAVGPPGAFGEARRGSSCSPSTSMMSRLGAPRAKEIVSGIAKKGTDPTLNPSSRAADAHEDAAAAVPRRRRRALVRGRLGDRQGDLQAPPQGPAG